MYLCAECRGCVNVAVRGYNTHNCFCNNQNKGDFSFSIFLPTGKIKSGTGRIIIILSFLTQSFLRIVIIAKGGNQTITLKYWEIEEKEKNNNSMPNP